MSSPERIKRTLRELSTLDEKLNYLTEICLHGDEETVRLTENFRWALCSDYRKTQAKVMARLPGGPEARDTQDQGPGDALPHEANGGGEC